jgi:hypothetical protein
VTDATAPTDRRLLQLNAADNVCVAAGAIEAGEVVMIAGQPIRVSEDIPKWHKIAVAPIAAGGKVLKYGMPIGSAACNIAPGQYVHTHNLKSDYLPICVADSAKVS